VGVNKALVKGRIEEVKGRIKEKAGGLVGHERLEAKGTM
jgi:uncharacterized protein YjbJ (UPF0337 family)